MGADALLTCPVAIQVRFRTHQIPDGLGDYMFAVKRAGVEHFLPFLCERKESVDLAASFRDGRWGSQVTKLRHACTKLNVPKAHLLLEGKALNCLDLFCAFSYRTKVIR